VQRSVNCANILAAYPAQEVTAKENAMRSARIHELNMLGYAIERLAEFDDTGLTRSIRYEVMCPETGAVLASQPSLRAARRFVIARELRAARADPQTERTMLIA
jgi:hypothetical protein